MAGHLLAFFPTLWSTSTSSKSLLTLYLAFLRSRYGQERIRQYKFDVSRTTDVLIELHIRNPNAAPGAGRSQDICIGTCKVSPRFEEAQPYVQDPKLSKKDKEKAALAYAEQERSGGQVGDGWIPLQYGTGELRVGVRFVESRQKSLKIEDFELLKVVGKGSFGKVMQVQCVLN